MKKLLPFLMFSLPVLLANAQTMTGTVLTQPCNNNGSIGVTVTGLTPPINYTYKNLAIFYSPIVHNNILSSSDIVSGLAANQLTYSNANTWTVTATDGTNTAVCVVTLTPAFTNSITVATNASCPAMGTLQATGFIGGTAPYACLWTELSTTQTYTANPALVPQGTYSLVVTDGAGCSVNSVSDSSGINVYIYTPIMLTFTGTPANCTNGTASVAAFYGTSPYTYLWSNGATTPSIGGLTQGHYDCLITDAVGCQQASHGIAGAGFYGYDVSQTTTINFNTSITNATCLQSNGSILGFASGGTSPYTFLWSNGSNSSNISNLLGGNYSVQITDASGCTKVNPVNISATTPISVTYAASPSSCTAPTGSATITATGGLAPYTIVWNTYPTSVMGNVISNKSSGVYPFTITDANGCIRTGSGVP